MAEAMNKKIENTKATLALLQQDMKIAREVIQKQKDLLKEIRLIQNPEVKGNLLNALSDLQEANDAKMKLIGAALMEVAKVVLITKRIFISNVNSSNVNDLWFISGSY